MDQAIDSHEAADEQCTKTQLLPPWHVQPEKISNRCNSDDDIGYKVHRSTAHNNTLDAHARSFFTDLGDYPVEAYRVALKNNHRGLYHATCDDDEFGGQEDVSQNLDCLWREYIQ